MNATQLGLSDLAMLLGPDHPGAEVCMTASKEIGSLRGTVAAQETAIRNLRAEVERLRGALKEAAATFDHIAVAEDDCDCGGVLCERCEDMAWKARNRARAALEEGK